LNSSNQKIFSDHYHLIEPSVKNGDRVKRGQTIGYIQRGRRTNLPHTHFVVIAEESPKKFAVMDPGDYWFGIDQYKDKLTRGVDVGPFAISCFDPRVNYPNEPLRFTYPVRCK
jgi:murein DD-endopeptidase MepM/ murein hydrolase activator NlpD